MTHVETRWPTMGCEAGVWLTGPRPREELLAVAATVRATVQDAARRLTRFDAGSELCRLNADPRPAVPASPVVRRFALAARWAGEVTDGLVDATRLDALEHAGYAASFTGRRPVALAGALRDAPARRPAAAHPDRAYAALQVGADGTVRRPPGVRLDSGGLGKGLAADLAAALVPEGVRYAIAIGGDLAVGGAARQPLAVRRAGGTGIAHTFEVPPGGVATSGVHARLWRRPGGDPAHHLIDPGSGRPAWTGLVAVTAVAEDAVAAEVLAKAALLAGPLAARRRLRARGGVLQHEDGRVEVLCPAPVVRVPRRAAA